ncbi:MAG TPA: PEP-CTERM sorting domain-containing protein [Aquabacterium sp.]|nr:PEP-CTERM sorting domain-containing protein [Aquabacterium sp.]
MRKFGLALLCASFGMLGAAHAASSASASVGNLTFQLIDLNPLDGVDASYSFAGTGAGSGTTTLQVSASDNGESDSASKTRNQLFYTGTLSASDFEHAGATSSVSLGGVSANGFANGPATSFSAQGSTQSPYYYTSGGTLSLSANSVLIITADASTSAKAYTNDSACYWCSSDYANASASFSLSYNYSDGKTYTNYSFNDAVNSNAYATPGHNDWVYDYSTGQWNTVYVPGQNPDASDARTFRAVFTNSTSQTQYASLSMSATVNGYGSVAFPAPTTGAAIAAVPEADSLSMALAGLGVAGFVVRRRRQA